MDYKDILAMASAYKEVAEASAKTRALQSIKAQPKDKVSLAKAPWEKEKEVKKEALDPVDQKALKGKHKDRKDKDIDNDGDVDKSDEYLHKRRKAVSASIKGKKKGTEVETEVQEMTKAQKRALQSIKAQPKDKVSLKKAPWDKKETKESVEEIDEAKATVKQQKALKALMTKALGGKRAKAGYTSYVGNNGDFIVYDGGGRIVGRLKAGEFQDPLKEEIEELEEGRMLAPAFHRVIKAHKYESDASGKNHTWPHGDRTTKIKHNGTHVVTYNQHDGSQVHKTPASLNRHLNALHDHEVDMKSVQEAKDHGNMNNGSPRGEGLSPSAKKELERTTPMNPATDELAVNNLNFKTFKAMVKKAPKRSADNDAGDKKAIASATSVKEELDLLEFTQEEIIDFMMTEDFAQLDELSKKTLGSYVKKASKSAADNARAMRSADEPFHTYRATSDKYVKRIKGISKANDKLTKESFDLSDFTQEEIIDFIVTEDFAQLDELSKNTLSSYLKKAAKSKNSAIDKAYKIKYNNAGTGSEMAPRSKKALDKHNKTIDKRTKGIGSFMKRDQAKNNPEYVHKSSATDRYKDGSAPGMTNKPASALHKSYKDRK